ncbi:MAG TPA: rhodanese-like domain-containing protein, partial [Anaerolineae bacterium]|nr:rhodanese-like domain-containing protein [Anaerolineae bacterium]
HIPQAQLIPLPKIISNSVDIPCNQEIILVCGRGRRSARAAHILRSHGCENVTILQGGMIGWEAAGLLEAIEL